MRGMWAGIAALGLAVAAPAMATNFSFSYGFGSTVFASGTITTDDLMPCGTGCFYVADVTGTHGTDPITGYDFFASSDQQFYPTATPHVTGSGLTYQVGNLSYNIYATGGNYNEVSYLTDDVDQSILSSNFVTFFNVAPVSAGAVPEPASWAIMVGGMALAGGAMRRQRARRGVASIS